MTEVALRGHPASPGAAVGPAWLLAPVAAAPSGTPAEERDRALAGLEQAAAELSALADSLRSQGHAADAEIVEANRLMAGDSALISAAAEHAMAGLPAAEAIAHAAEPHVDALSALDDPTLAARAADLRSIARRAGELATGRGEQPPSGSVVLADDLGPADVAAWAARVSAIALAASGSTAHAAIVARSLAIPLVTGAGPDLFGIERGDEVAVDGDRGLVFHRPAGATRERIERRMSEAREQATRNRAERQDAVVTTDGRSVRLLANAGTVAEVEAALEAGAEGVGLLRSELAFLDASGWPSEEEHVRVLEPMLALLADRVATVRTLDFGGDKTPPFLVGTGAQSMMGPRGIRAALSAEGGVEPQLRAILRCSCDSILRILIPMVTEAAEVEAVRELVLRARDDVVPGAPDPLVGAMIEVPAAALNAHPIAAACDFLSIGTNDLVQYTLAADRQNPDVAERAVAYHPAVIRLVARVMAAARSASIPVEVCGEAAGDPELLPLIVGMGVDEISVSPARIAQTRRMIRALSLQRARAAAAEALTAGTAAEVAAIACAAAAPSGERLEQAGDRVQSG